MVVSYHTTISSASSLSSASPATAFASPTTADRHFPSLPPLHYLYHHRRQICEDLWILIENCRVPKIQWCLVGLGDQFLRSCGINVFSSNLAISKILWYQCCFLGQFSNFWDILCRVAMLKDWGPFAPRSGQTSENDPWYNPDPCWILASSVQFHLKIWPWVHKAILAHAWNPYDPWHTYDMILR